MMREKRWRGRDGSVHGLTMTGSAGISWAVWEEECRKAGWPGHAGTWWDYLKDDVRAVLARIVGEGG